MHRAAIEELAPRAQTVHRLAEGLGFAMLGIAPAEPSAYADEVKAWLGAGKHGEMRYLAQHLDQRLDPSLIVPGAKAIICVADRYHGHLEARREAGGKRPEATGRIARYAWGDDYHRHMKKRMHDLADTLREVWPEHTFRSAVDTAPVLEREHALRAGLGWIGKNTMLIHPQLGSWLLLGEIITTLPLQTSFETSEGVIADHCGTCTRCIDACPTRCITPHEVDARRCISYLTLEHREPIEPALFGQMGDWVAGCDVCQEVCPFNQDRPHNESLLPRAESDAGAHPAYRPRELANGLPLLDVLNWSPEDRQRAFEKSALKRVKLEQLKRNALIAAGNFLAGQPDPVLRSRVEAIANDAGEHELVVATARAVLDRLAGT